MVLRLAEDREVPGNLRIGAPLRMLAVLHPKSWKM